MSGNTSERLRSLYLWRITNYVVVGLECALLAAETFLFHNLLGAIGAVFAIGIMLLAVRRNASSIAQTQRSLHRPDYALIASMEREVYGEAFHHDGAPPVAALPARAACKGCCSGHPVVAGYCQRCWNIHRLLLGPVPDGMTATEYAAKSLGMTSDRIRQMARTAALRASRPSTTDPEKEDQQR